MRTAVILPMDYASDEQTRFPVVYLLHGAGNDHTTYLQPSILKSVDRGHFLAVIPDGGTDWWMDSPILPTVRRETFVVQELVSYVDTHFRTIPQKEMRTIAGHSMGGQGASRIGMRHTDLFGAVGNIIGGVDIQSYTNRRDLIRLLGPSSENAERWRDYSVTTEAKRLQPSAIHFFSIVGTDDFFLESNRELHRILTNRKIAHEYTEVRGETDELSRHSRLFAYRALERILARFAELFALRRVQGSKRPEGVGCSGATTLSHAEMQRFTKVTENGRGALVATVRRQSNDTRHESCDTHHLVTCHSSLVTGAKRIASQLAATPPR
ncbi:MAG: hypothetical protein IKR48_00565 [Kiritimatiellae bacterium]|nr:hypothetical protein [Kiritimatiellia bacterium]